ncbi:MAG: glycosyltransferase [Rhodobacteraceae bacterium]|jgi:GT2 family glycosyltransferase|nr:glycosyltransferase [Paracoccaceae bacterium]MBL4557565.1 glycosyltransferase [Paracoccaceae bacterium]HBG97948.1 glycosyltransferase [Paracoccaceae bacterium]
MRPDGAPGQTRSGVTERPGPPSLVAVVVTHNRLAQLQITIARLLASPARELAAVVVVDNASTDGTWRWLTDQSGPRLVTRRCDRNIGGAGGFELGIGIAAERFDPDWLVVMDDDARPEPGALAAFHARPREASEAWAAAVYHPDGRICEINRPSRNPFWHRDAFLAAARRGRAGFHIADSAYASAAPTAIDAASFVGLFLSRRALALAGRPEGRLFIYGDDVLYTLGLRQAGGRIAFDPGLRFEHDYSTARLHGGALRPLWKVYYHHRNLLLVYRRAAGPALAPVLALILPKWLMAARRYASDRPAYLRLLRLAVADGLRGRLDRPHGEILRLAG